MHSLVETALKVLNEILKRKEALIGVGLIVLVYLGFLVGKSTCGECEKDIVCKTFISDNRVLEEQLKKCQSNCLKNKIDLVKKCQEEERKACQDKVEKFKKVYKDLKCTICDKRGR